MLDYAHGGRAAVCTLSRPPVNAINGEWIDEFHRALDDMVGRGGVSVLHVRSDQKAFCAGADLKFVQGCFAGDDGADAMIAFVRRIQELYVRIENLEQVTVAEIGGAAMGGGLELALACDLRIAAAEAKMGLPEVGLGLLPGAGGTQRLTALCGPGLSKRIILGAEIVDGATAESMGIVHWSAPRDGLSARAGELVGRLAGLPARALAESKRCIHDHAAPERDGFETEVEGTRRLIDSPETRERVGAFLARSAT